MGKVGAFLEHDRRAHGERPVAQRVEDFADIAVPLDAEDQRIQASRCMCCGVAFCQTGASFGPARASGCPLHNLIPEWNDLLWRDLWVDAAARMRITNPFPEFTGRVCPALCEAACNLGRDQGATTIKDDERAISDHEWADGGPAGFAGAPAALAELRGKRVGIVGSGPSGLACAWELARRGASVTVVEKSDRAGGLLQYGIPEMKLPKDVVARRVAWLEEQGVAFETETDACDPMVAQALLGLDAVVIAAGAGQARGLNCPGSDLPGVVMAVDYLTAATKAVDECWDKGAGRECPGGTKVPDASVPGGGGLSHGRDEGRGRVLGQRCRTRVSRRDKGAGRKRPRAGRKRPRGHCCRTRESHSGGAARGLHGHRGRRRSALREGARRRRDRRRRHGHRLCGDGAPRGGPFRAPAGVPPDAAGHAPAEQPVAAVAQRAQERLRPAGPDASVPGDTGAGHGRPTPEERLAADKVTEDVAGALCAKGLDVVVIGGGDTGTDCVATALREGARSVRQLEFLPMPPATRLPSNPWPQWPNELKNDYGQQEAEALQGADPRTFAVDTREVVAGENGRVAALRTVRLDWSAGRPDAVPGSEEEIPAQLVLVATGFTGPRSDVLMAFDVAQAEKRPVAAVLGDGHRALRSPGADPTPVFACGDARNGATLVVMAIADGLACASEVAEALR